jgi:hypothetical protein
MRAVFLISFLATIIIGTALGTDDVSFNNVKASLGQHIDERNTIDAYAYTSGDFDVSYDDNIDTLTYIESVRRNMSPQCTLGDKYLTSATMTYRDTVLTDAVKQDIDNTMAAAC